MYRLILFVKSKTTGNYIFSAWNIVSIVLPMKIARKIVNSIFIDFLYIILVNQSWKMVRMLKNVD